MLQCEGKGCTAQLSATAAADGWWDLAGQIPHWIVKRPERRFQYARRVFGPRCARCRAKLIRELRS
jgi:hypothetical protein